MRKKIWVYRVPPFNKWVQVRVLAEFVMYGQKFVVNPHVFAGGYFTVTHADSGDSVEKYGKSVRDAIKLGKAKLKRYGKEKILKAVKKAMGRKTIKSKPDRKHAAEAP